MGSSTRDPHGSGGVGGGRVAAHRRRWSRRLAEAGVEQLLDRRRRQRLPERLSLSAINMSENTIEIVAVERRDYDERAPRVRPRRTSGRRRGHTAQGVSPCRYTWPFDSALEYGHRGGCTLHISEGFGRYDYSDATARFGAVIGGFLDLDRFVLKDIGRAIRRLHDAEKSGAPEARSHRVGYLSHGGRTGDADDEASSSAW